MAITGELLNFGLTLTGTWKYTGIISSSVDRKIYAVPRNAPDILIIDPATLTAEKNALGASLSGTDKFIGAVEGVDGCIYGIPYSSTTILKINPATRTATRSAMGASLSGSFKWQGGAPGVDGCIYGAPWLSDYILKIDPVAGVASMSNYGAAISGIPYGGGSGRFHGVVGHSNGLIYFCPTDSEWILILNPVAGVAVLSKLGATIASGGTKWGGMGIGSDDCIYCIPFNATTILKINPSIPSGVLVGGIDAGTATTTTMGCDLSGSGKWDGLGVSYAGKIITTPWNATNLLVIDPALGIAYRDSFGLSLSPSQKCHEGFGLGADACLYSSPFDHQYVIRIDMGEEPPVAFGSVVGLDPATAAVSLLTPTDLALFPSQWSVVADDSSNPTRLVQTVRWVTEDTIAADSVIWPRLLDLDLPVLLVQFDGALTGGVTYQLTVNGGTMEMVLPVMSESGQTAVPLDEDHSLRDLSNPYLSRDALRSPVRLGTFQVMETGDYGLSSGDAGLRERVIRRILHAAGAFFHAPGYGALQSPKTLLLEESMIRLQTKILTQIRKEPDVTDAVVSVTRLPTWDGVSVAALVQRQSSKEPLRVEVPVRV
jgi:hypothetical protein